MSTATHPLKLAASPRHVRLRSHPRLSPELNRWLREREDEAFERGRCQTEANLTGQLVSQRAEMLQLQDGVLKSLAAGVDNVIRETERALVELALTTASRMVAGLPLDRTMIEAGIREALTQVEDSATVQVLLHGEDLATLKQAGSPYLEESAAGRLRLVAAPDVTRGGCVVRTQFGDIDARRETKLEQMRKALNS